jgi:hypothetical protein
MNVNVQILRLIYCHYGNDGRTVYSCKMILKDCKTCHTIKGDVACLKVPKREIFDRSDFPDFYTIQSLRVGNFGVKIKN